MKVSDKPQLRKMDEVISRSTSDIYYVSKDVSNNTVFYKLCNTLSKQRLWFSPSDIIWKDNVNFSFDGGYSWYIYTGKR